MRSTQKILIGGAVVAVTVIVGVVIGLVGGGSTPAPVTVANDTPTHNPQNPPPDHPQPQPVANPHPPVEPVHRPVIAPHNTGVSPTPAPHVAAAGTSTNWEAKLN